MKASRFSEEQIIGMIKEQEAGMPTANMPQAWREQRFYKYKAKFGGMDVSAARLLKVLDDENTGSRSCWQRRCWARLKDLSTKNV